MNVGEEARMREWDVIADARRSYDERHSMECAEADRMTDDLSEFCDPQIPTNAIRSATKNLFRREGNDHIDHIHDFQGGRTGVTVKYDRIYDRPVISVCIPSGVAISGAHFNITVIDSHDPVTVTVNRIIPDASGDMTFEQKKLVT